MTRLPAFAAIILALLSGTDAAAQQPGGSPIRVAVARLTHGHVARIWAYAHPDIQIVGIYEPDAELVDRLQKRYKFDRAIVYSDLATMLDASKPDAVVAFGSIYEHMAVVRAAAPRKVHVMVEKPLAMRVDHAVEMERLAKHHGIHLLTNYGPRGTQAWRRRIGCSRATR